MTGPDSSADRSHPFEVGGAFWDMSVDMLAVASLDGYLTAVNPSWERVLGYTAEEMIAQPYTDFVHPDDLVKTFAEAQAMFDPAHVTVNFENRYRGKDGAYCWLSWSARVADGGRDILCIVRDVSEQVLARQRLEVIAKELMDSERRYQLVAENATDIVVLVDSAGVITWASLGAQQVLGYHPADLVGTDLEDLAHPQDVPSAFSLRSGSDGGDARVHFEAQMRTVDGQYWWMTGFSGPDLDAAGNVVGRIFAARDVHEQVLARLALAVSERQYRLVAENTADVVFLLGQDGLYIWVSPSIEKVLGYRPEDVVGTGVLDFVHPEDHPLIISVQARLWQGETAVHFEVRNRTAAGEYRWMAGIANPGSTQGDSLPGRVVALRDVHEEVLARLAPTDS